MDDEELAPSAADDQHGSSRCRADRPHPRPADPGPLRSQQQPRDMIAPDQNRVVEGLGATTFFTVVAEQFVTDTARFADLVLPVTTQIEQTRSRQMGTPPTLRSTGQRSHPGARLGPTTTFSILATEMGLDDPSLHESDEMLVVLEGDHPLLDGVTWRTSRHTWCRFSS